MTTHTETAGFAPCHFRDGWFVIQLADGARIEGTSAEWERAARALERGMAQRFDHLHVLQLSGATHIDALTGPDAGLRVTLVGSQVKALARQIRQTMIQHLMPPRPAEKLPD
jgi:hypothetical protein